MKFDAITFCQDYGIPYWTEGKNMTSGWVAITCPFCSDTSNHGGFNTQKGYYNCWKCGSKPLYTAVQKLTNERNIKNILKKYGIVRGYDVQINQERKEKFVLPGDIPLKKIHKNYLEERNFDPDYLEMKYQLRGTDHLGKYKFRIIIPVIQNMKTVSFIARDITGQQELRYKACPKAMEIIEAKQTLYNIDNCYLDRVLGVEGVFDVFRIGNNCFGTFGTSFTSGQLNQMHSFKRVFMLYDSETEAQDKAEKALFMLNSIGITTEIITLDAGDPAEMNDNDVVYLKKDLKIY